MTTGEQDPIATLYIWENVFSWYIFSIATTRSIHISNQQSTLNITAEKTTTTKNVPNDRVEAIFNPMLTMMIRFIHSFVILLRCVDIGTLSTSSSSHTSYNTVLRFKIFTVLVMCAFVLLYVWYSTVFCTAFTSSVFIEINWLHRN